MLRYKLCCFISIMLLSLPMAWGVDNSIVNDKLELTVDFTTGSDNRMEIGFTNRDIINLFDDIPDLEGIMLKYDSDKKIYSGSVNLFYQMENFDIISATLSVKTPFIDKNEEVIKASINYKTRIDGTDSDANTSQVTKELNIDIYSKSNTIWRDYGLLELDFYINESDLAYKVNSNALDITTTATFSLTVLSE